MTTNYTARTYAEIRTELLTFASRRLPQWTDRSSSDMGVLLVEMYAYMGDIINLYIDRVMNEQVLRFAALPTSVENIALLAGVERSPMVPATGEVQFTSANTVGAGVDVVIPAGTSMATSFDTGASPVFFTTDDELTLTGPGDTGNVGVTQGAVYTETVAQSSGAALQSYELLNPDVVSGDVSVQVGSVVWLYRRNLSTAARSDRAFTVDLRFDGVGVVRFGDGVSGVVPPHGHNISVTYRTASGSAGNVPAGSITSMVSGISGVGSVTNAAPTTGGANADSAQSLSRKIPTAARAVERAVTAADHTSLALRVPGVLHANAEAEFYTNVSLWIVPQGGGSPSPALVSDIDEFFSTRVLAGGEVVVYNPTYVAVEITMDLFVLDGFIQADVEQAVRDALDEEFELENVRLGQDVPVSRVYRRIIGSDPVPGVDYIVVTLLAREDEGSPSGTDTLVYLPNEVPTLATPVSISSVGGL